MSAPAEKNFGFALRTITTRTPADAIAASTAAENSVMNVDVVRVGGRVVERDEPERALGW